MISKKQALNVKVRTTILGRKRYDWDTRVGRGWDGKVAYEHHTYIGPNPPEYVLLALRGE